MKNLLVSGADYRRTRFGPKLAPYCLQAMDRERTAVLSSCREDRLSPRTAAVNSEMVFPLTEVNPVRSRSAESLFFGPGEVRSIGRGLDWANTPLGAVESWPQSLRSTVRTLLSSQYPMVLTWGPEFTQIYNDAYSKLIGDRHPAGLGNDIRVTLAESWSVLGPMISRVMSTGSANWTPALPLEMHRAGYREEAYFSVSHAPAEDDNGVIVGMLAVCSEVTDQIVGQRRLRLLRDLASRAGEAQETAEAVRNISAAISDHGLDVPFAEIYLEETGRLVRSGSIGPQIGAQGTIASRDADPWSVLPALEGRTTTVADVDRKVSCKGGLFSDPVTTAVTLPIAGAKGIYLGAIVVGASPNRELDDDYQSFFELLAAQVSIALRNARAREDERRRVEELAELDRAKTQFFANISHEFRTPLTLLLGPLEDALAAEPDRLHEHREHLALARRNALRLLRLVNALLDFSRVEANRANASLQPTDLAELTVDLASNFRSTIESAGLRFDVEARALPRQVYVDRDMYEKIVLNLLSNAFKFTLEGSIKVTLRDLEGQGIELVVADTGAGIPESQLFRVFERFHRIEGQASRSHEGTGIGLALVESLVGLHAGSIAVESPGPGHGSSFIVRLPYERPSDKSATESTLEGASTRADAFVEEAERWIADVSAATARQPGLSKVPRILLADDNADMRAYVQHLLQHAYDVVPVASGKEALAAVGREVPDLVLTDVMMPGLDGFGLLHELRADPRTATIPVIFLSARAGEEARIESLEAGADDHIVKPFGAQELLARIAGTLRLADFRGDAASRERLLEARLATAEADAARVRTEQQLRTLADALPVLISHVSEDLRYLFVNRAYEQWFGRTRDEVVGRSVSDVIGGEALEAVLPKIQQVLAGEHLSFEQFMPYSETQQRHVHVDYVPQVADGEVRGFYALVQDVSIARRQAAELADREQRIRMVLDSVSDGFYAVDAKWRITLFNKAAELHLGKRKEEVLGRDLWAVFPQARGTAFEGHLRQVMDLRSALNFEIPSLLQQGRFVEMRAAPAETGGIAVAFSDITERKVSEQHRKLLIDELNHRVKNTLAVVQSIAAQTFKDDQTSPQARAAYEGRLMALSSAHGLLTEESWESAPIKQLLLDALSAFDIDRFKFDISPLRIAPKPAVSLVLALHELATNATKYGALSNDQGSVVISCDIAGDEEPLFQLVWREIDGPRVVKPSKKGFGTRLIQRGLAAEFGGQVGLDFETGGLTCTIVAPLRNMVSPL